VRIGAWVRDAFSLSSASWASAVQEKHSCFLGADRGQAFLAEPRDEAAQGGEAPQHPLNTFEVPNRTHLFEGCNLLGVGLDASLGDNVSQKPTPRYAKDTFFGVQFYPVSP
jgi:hypothetical protein